MRASLECTSEHSDEHGDPGQDLVQVRWGWVQLTRLILCSRQRLTAPSEHGFGVQGCVGIPHWINGVAGMAR